jgi:anti-sigma B factor antagonist
VKEPPATRDGRLAVRRLLVHIGEEALLPQSPHLFTDYLGGGIRVVALLGEHDVSTRPVLSDELRRLAEAGGSVIVDLSDCDFIDTSVLNVLVSTHRRANRTGGHPFAVVVRPDSAVDRIFQLTHARALFVVFASRSDAVDWCRLERIATIA